MSKAKTFTVPAGRTMRIDGTQHIISKGLVLTIIPKEKDHVSTASRTISQDVIDRYFPATVEPEQDVPVVTEQVEPAETPIEVENHGLE
jgi:hypothetical protein